MYCSHCGKRIPPESNYCPNCGASAAYLIIERTSRKDFHAWIIVILIVSALFTTGMSVYLVVNSVNFLDKGLRVEAVIVDVLRGYKGSDYTPVYEFTDPRTGIQVRVVGLGRDWPPYQVGQVVNILYDPTQGYEGNRVRQAEFVWLAPILCTVVSVGIWFSVFAFTRIRRGSSSPLRRRRPTPSR